MLIPCTGLDRRLIKKKDGSGYWSVAFVKLESGDVAEVFTDSVLCEEFEVGQPLALDLVLTSYDKRLSVRVNSVKVSK